MEKYRTAGRLIILSLVTSLQERQRHWQFALQFLQFLQFRCSQIEIGRFCFLSWSTIMAISRPITTFFQPVKSSEIENETVNGEEAEAEATEFENSKLFYAFIPFPEKC